MKRSVLSAATAAIWTLAAALAAAQPAVSNLVVTCQYAPAPEAKGELSLRHTGPATFAFDLAVPAEVAIEIHADAHYEPKLVKTITLGKQPAGRVRARWDGLDKNGEAIYKVWRTFSCTVSAGDVAATAFWSAPLELQVPKDSTATLTVVPGAHLLLAEGDQEVPFALQILNCGEENTTWKLDGSVIGPGGDELLKLSASLDVPPLSVAARTWPVRQKRNGIATASFAASYGEKKLAASTTFGRVAPHRKRFERDSYFASVWVRDCKFADAIGIKYSRQNDVYWTSIQKQPDQPYDWGDPRERGPTLDGFIVDRERNHMWMLSILGYGEDWLGGSFMGCTIFNYDRFVNDYCVEVMNHVRDHHSLLQFWNEPNCFWHVPMDQYYLVQQRVFSRIKTLDKNAFVMGDGHTGAESNNRFIARMAELGYAPYTTALAVHYPCLL